MRNPLFLRIAFAGFLVLAVASIIVVQRPFREAAPASHETKTTVTLPTLRVNFTQPVKQPESTGIHNVFALSPTLFCGSDPEGETGFQSLKQLGIRTIVSVDGSYPNLKLAEKEGLRYVHLPIGYDGVPRSRVLEIAAVISNAEQFGPVYLHCHHGKHRGPAAAVAAARCIDPAYSAHQAEELLKMIGTDPKYAGLYRDVANVTPLTESEQLKNYTFAEKQPVSSLIERMVAIDATWDRIKLCQKAGWKSPADHPDVTPAHEALQLVEHFRELARIEAPSKVFARRQITATNLAEELEQNLRSNAGTIIIDSFFKNIGNSCSECHAKTRDQKPR